MVSLIINYRAIPIYFGLLDCVGNRDLETQTAILESSFTRTPIQYSESIPDLGLREFSKAEISLSEYPKK